MRRARTFFLASALFAASAASAHSEVNVVASIKPIHSLVAAVMSGVGEPGLIVEGTGSPHNYALKPSQARKLESAKVVFWVGHELEAFLEKPLETVGAKAKSVALIDAHGLEKLGFREGGAFDKHGHGDEAGHDDHDHEKKAEADHDHDHEKKAKDDHDHDHEKKAEAKHDHDHDHEKKAKDDHDHDHDHKKKAKDDHDHDHEKKAEAEHDHGEEHAHGEFDAHVWLDPKNAKAMVHEIEEALAEADPGNAKKYEANAKAVMAKLDKLIAEVSADLEPVKGKGFIVFHDAYQYFEKRFAFPHPAP